MRYKKKNKSCGKGLSWLTTWEWVVPKKSYHLKINSYYSSTLMNQNLPAFNGLILTYKLRMCRWGYCLRSWATSQSPTAIRRRWRSSVSQPGWSVNTPTINHKQIISEGREILRTIEVILEFYISCAKVLERRIKYRLCVPIAFKMNLRLGMP